MKKLLVGPLLFFLCPILFASSPQESLNKVYEATGSSTEIAKRAQACMVRILRNDAVQLGDASRSAFRPSDTSEGGQLLTLVDLEGGVLIATHRVHFSSWGMGHVAQAVLTVNTKDGRFKMETTDIKAAQLNTGAIANSGFVEYRERAPAFKAAVKELGEVQQKLVACIQNTSSNDW